jgi:predicted Rossmann-fold nucleotide-binding protein
MAISPASSRNDFQDASGFDHFHARRAQHSSSPGSESSQASLNAASEGRLPAIIPLIESPENITPPHVLSTLSRVSVPLNLPSTAAPAREMSDLLGVQDENGNTNMTDRQRKDFLNCLLAALCVGYKSADGQRINNVAQLRDITGFDAKLFGSKTENIESLQLNNVPSHAVIRAEGGLVLRPRYQQLIRAVLQALVVDHQTPTESLKNALVSQLPLASASTLSVLHTLIGAGVVNGPLYIRSDSGAEDLISLDGIKRHSVAFWGGGSISGEEYDYSASVGKAIMAKLQRIDESDQAANDDSDAHFTAITGSGPGVMKGPMMGLKKSDHEDERYQCLGLSQTSIIAVEAPNHHVDKLVIFHDMEKRLEAFMRTGQGLVVFPGGIGTLEEILYLLSVTLHAENEHNAAVPVIFTGPDSASEYYGHITTFLAKVAGSEAADYVNDRLVIGSAKSVANAVVASLVDRDRQREQNGVEDRFDPLFDHHITIPEISQHPYSPSAENIQSLNSFFERQQGHDVETRKEVVAARLRQLVHVVFRMTLNKRAGMAGMAGLEGASLSLPEVVRQPLKELMEQLRLDGRLKVTSADLEEIFASR